MKRIKPLIFLILPLLLCGCKNKGKLNEVTVNISGIIDSATPGGYDVTIKYHENEFNDKATTENEYIKMLSFGASMVTDSDDKASTFYKKIGFDNINLKLVDPTQDTVGYIMAHKSFKKYDLISVSVRGLGYGPEWANNFTMGKTGNHTGFSARADEIKTALNSYMNSYKSKKVKIWLTGYSRGGAIANVLASRLLSSGSDSKNLFVYTFEAPRGLSQENAKAYDNVFNYVNDVDIVTKIAPKEYGLYRCGKDIVINANKNVDSLLKELDNNISIPRFYGNEGKYTTEKGFAEYLLSQLMKDTGNDSVSLMTRTQFFNNYEQHIAYFIGLYETLPYSTVNKIMNKFTSMDASSLSTTAHSEYGLYNAIRPVLLEDGITFDNAVFLSACKAINKILDVQFDLIANIVMNQSMRGNLQRMIYMHSQESIYVLLK